MGDNIRRQEKMPGLIERFTRRLEYSEGELRFYLRKALSELLRQGSRAPAPPMTFVETKEKEPMLKKIFAILCALCLISCIPGVVCAESTESIQGKAMPDFTVELTDGTTVTLSELLKTKEVVVLNIFATWCGPCQGEFPEMEAVYRQYQDRMEIVAASAYEGDDMDTLRSFKEEMGLTFPMGQAGADITGNVDIPGYPTSLIIDRNGQVAYYGAGAFVNGEAFEKLVTLLMGDDYTGSQLWLYTVFVADQWGELVQNAELQIRTDNTSETVNVGEAGFTFVATTEPTTYHITIQALPEGYSAYDDEEAVTGAESGYFQLNAYRQNR